MSGTLRQTIYQALSDIRVIDPYTRINPRKPAVDTLAELLADPAYTRLFRSVGSGAVYVDDSSEPLSKRASRIAQALSPIENTVPYRWLIDTCKHLFGFKGDCFDESSLEDLLGTSEPKMVSAQWAEVVAQESNIDALFFSSDFDDSLEGFDSKIFVPCLRADELVFRLASPAIRERLAACTEIQISDLPDLRSSLERCVEHFVARQARSCVVAAPWPFSPLPVTDGRATTALDAVLRQGEETDRHHLQALGRRVFWTLVELCEHHGLPIQLNLGIDNSLLGEHVPQAQGLRDDGSSWVQYQELFNAFPDLNFLLSVSGPALHERMVSSASHLPNVFTVGHLEPANLPAAIVRDLRMRLDAVPQAKQVGYFSDAPSIEFVWAKFHMYRQSLANILADDFVLGRNWSEERAVQLGCRLLRENVESIFYRSADELPGPSVDPEGTGGLQETVGLAVPAMELGQDPAASFSQAESERAVDPDSHAESDIDLIELSESDSGDLVGEAFEELDDHDLNTANDLEPSSLATPEGQESIGLQDAHLEAEGESENEPVFDAELASADEQADDDLWDRSPETLEIDEPTNAAGTIPSEDPIDPPIDSLPDVSEGSVLDPESIAPVESFESDTAHASPSIPSQPANEEDDALLLPEKSSVMSIVSEPGPFDEQLTTDLNEPPVFDAPLAAADEQTDDQLWSTLDEPSLNPPLLESDPLADETEAVPAMGTAVPEPSDIDADEASQPALSVEDEPPVFDAPLAVADEQTDEQLWNALDEPSLDPSLSESNPPADETEAIPAMETAVPEPSGIDADESAQPALSVEDEPPVFDAPLAAADEQTDEQLWNASDEPSLDPSLSESNPPADESEASPAMETAVPEPSDIDTDESAQPALSVEDEPPVFDAPLAAADEQTDEQLWNASDEPSLDPPVVEPAIMEPGEAMTADLLGADESSGFDAKLVPAGSQEDEPLWVPQAEPFAEPTPAESSQDLDVAEPELGVGDAVASQSEAPEPFGMEPDDAMTADLLGADEPPAFDSELAASDKSDDDLLWNAPSEPTSLPQQDPANLDLLLDDSAPLEKRQDHELNQNHQIPGAEISKDDLKAGDSNHGTS